MLMNMYNQESPSKGSTRRKNKKEGRRRPYKFQIGQPNSSLADHTLPRKPRPRRPPSRTCARPNPRPRNSPPGLRYRPPTTSHPRPTRLRHLTSPGSRPRSRQEGSGWSGVLGSCYGEKRGEVSLGG
ncbi:hypothetical protein BC936DRAFT_147360 [Jimgerdemannia flammicorona]|uniref:Uncharacterized protein n=1 Tax=Jimgerdemannia flammicorona TaxID=994334 RepID=A0A433D5G7_9FUNG|nr:hypothetical protein BC936DRAFT_147360 [Jimgerdemannia flammicorona]